MKRIVLGTLSLALALALAAVELAAAAVPPLTGPNAPPPNIAELTLPTGRLAYVSASARAAGFIDLDHVDHGADGIVTGVLLRIYDPGIPSRGMVAVQTVARMRWFCSKHVSQELGVQAFDEDGALVIWLPPDSPEPVRPNTGSELLARFLCEGAELPAGDVLTGHANALSEGRRLLRAAR